MASPRATVSAPSSPSPDRTAAPITPALLRSSFRSSGLSRTSCARSESRPRVIPRATRSTTSRWRPIHAPAGVARVDASLATDGLVNEFDARDPGVPQRVFLPASLRELVDGHGGSLVNRQIADLVVETVRMHEVPPDRRDPITRLLAPILWDQETRLWRRFLLVAALGA